MSAHFIGRKIELNDLKRSAERGNANLVVVQGRRRIGKSRLIEEFAHNQTFYNFAGLAPGKDINTQMQRDEFARQFSEQFSLPKFSMDDWGDLFTLLYKQVKTGKVIILFDEISWLGDRDPTFLGKLKNAWDKQFKHNPNLTLVLCGSVSSWIEENIISNTLFLGRPTLYLKLNPLTLPECNEFWLTSKHIISAYEKFKLLSVTGGVPRYLELINPTQTAEENIRAMCFSPNAPLLDEFNHIFADIFGKRSEVYKKIVRKLVAGSATLSEILEHCQRTKSGDFSQYLKDLELAGFITRDYTCLLQTGKQSKLSKYRLQDNYVRFYLKYIEPNKDKIDKGFFEDSSVSNLPAWSSIMGLQFQNLVLNNQKLILAKLQIPIDEIIFINPFFQKQTKHARGCQIDLLIQTKFNTLFVCEIKFSKSPIGIAVIDEVKQKIARIKLPSNYSCRPVLIHVGSITDTVAEEKYFSHIIDFSDLLSM